MNRQQVENFIHENFGGISQDFPWEDSPEYTVFRHVDNHKWFALIMRVKYITIDINQPGELDIINVKSDPDLVEELTKLPGIIQAYHMNKRHWVTILLDGSCADNRIKSLISLSYQLTSKKSKTHTSML